MKVKIGDTVFDGDVLPVMVILDDDDKANIRAMKGQKYCCYPESMSDETIDKWMKEIDNVYAPMPATQSVEAPVDATQASTP